MYTSVGGLQFEIQHLCFEFGQLAKYRSYRGTVTVVRITLISQSKGCIRAKHDPAVTYALLYILEFLGGQDSVLELCTFLFRYPARYSQPHASMSQYRIPSAKRDPGRQGHILVPESIPADPYNQLITCLYVRTRTFESIDRLYDLIKRQVYVLSFCISSDTAPAADGTPADADRICLKRLRSSVITDSTVSCGR